MEVRHAFEKTICLAIVAALPLVFQAQTKADQADEEVKSNAINLQDTYVKVEYPEIEQLRNTKEIIVISAKQIKDKGNRTLSDVLAKVSGISVGLTSLGEIDIRGQGVGQASRNLQVYADGVPITTLTNHPNHTNYDVIPIEQLEKIEFAQGGPSGPTVNPSADRAFFVGVKVTY